VFYYSADEAENQDIEIIAESLLYIDVFVL